MRVEAQAWKRSSKAGSPPIPVMTTSTVRAPTRAGKASDKAMMKATLLIPGLSCGSVRLPGLEQLDDLVMALLARHVDGALVVGGLQPGIGSPVEQRLDQHPITVARGEA